VRNVLDAHAIRVHPDGDDWETLSRRCIVAKILYLDDFRPRVTETMRCLFCGMVHVLCHIVTGTRPRYYPCPGCDETASVPEWSLRAR